MEIIKRGEVKGEGRFTLHLLDFTSEIRKAYQIAPSMANKLHFDSLARAQLIADGILPSCFDLEHRNGICPHGHEHPMHEQRGSNTIVRSLRESICLQMTGSGTPANLFINKIAYGTSADPTSQTMTQLVAEYYRKDPTDRLNPTPDQVQIYGNLTASEGNAPSNLQEFGILAGGASAIAGTGVLIARFLQNYAKTSGNIASVSYLATFT